jgi:hypothetical protein
MYFKIQISWFGFLTYSFLCFENTFLLNSDRNILLFNFLLLFVFLIKNYLSFIKPRKLVELSGLSNTSSLQNVDHFSSHNSFNPMSHSNSSQVFSYFFKSTLNQFLVSSVKCRSRLIK